MVEVDNVRVRRGSHEVEFNIVTQEMTFWFAGEAAGIIRLTSREALLEELLRRDIPGYAADVILKAVAPVMGWTEGGIFP